MSTHGSTKIDQKEYLKKYLSGDKKKKKKDKKHKTKATVRIIDDDVSTLNNGAEIDEDLLLGGDDAPQIVGEYVLERANAPKWRNIAVKYEKEEDVDEEVRAKEAAFEDLWDRKSKQSTLPLKQVIVKREQLTPDNSPPRKLICSPGSNNRKKQRRESNSSSDQSPPRRSTHSQRRDTSSYLQKSTLRTATRSRSRDYSPARRRRNNNSSDQSPPRRAGRSSYNQSHSPGERKKSKERSPHRRKHKENTLDQSPARRNREKITTDQSPERRKDRINNEKSTSPSRRSRWEKIATPSPPPTHKPKQTKTLDGKRAGLQDAPSLQNETEDRRRAEERMFEEMSNDVSGRNAEVQVRSTRRRGKRARDAEAEDPEVQRQKAEHEKKKQELYDRWGKGLKQIDDHRERREAQEYESSKPLARYSDDADLERHLREQERADDPMLEYMRRKQQEQRKKGNAPTLPVYRGTYTENRFGLRPGYRWDGVDRSNGYEKKWFDVQNERRAFQDEAYKYSVEDM